MASTSSTPSEMHGLTASQLSELQGAVQALDSYLLVCVDDLRNNRWARPNSKHVADCLVRELVRNVGHRFQVKPIVDPITLDHRTKLLTRRVRAVMRAFNKNRNYISEKPNISWDDSFIPPELYDDLESELARLDAKESQQVKKEAERESRSPKIEEQMAKEKVKATQNKGKAKDTLQDTEHPDDSERLKRKWTRKTSESSVFDIASDDEDDTSADEAGPLAKRVKRKKSIDDVGIFPVPPPCQRCTISHIECKSNGWQAACKSCRNARQACSLSKASPNDNEKAKETAEDNEKPDDTEKPKTRRIREIHTSIYTLSKSIQDDRSSIEDEDVDQLDEVLAKSSPKKKNVSTTVNDGFIPYDPKCDRCEQSNKECVRREDQDHGVRCTYCARLKKGCSRTILKGQSKIKYIPNDPKCDRCEEFYKECVRRETQDHGARCTQCDESKKGCKYQSKINYIANDPKCDSCQKSHKECLRTEAQNHGTTCKQCTKDKRECSLSRDQSKIDSIPNDPKTKCERCERSQRECVRKEAQDYGARCKQCVKSHQVCKYLSKGQSKITKSKPPPPKASKSMEESSSFSSHNFDLELMQQQLKASQEDFRIAQQQLQLANSRIAAQRELYEAQLAGYRGQGSGKVKQWGDERRNRV